MNEICRITKLDLKYIYKSKILLICLILVPVFYGFSMLGSQTSSGVDSYNDYVEQYNYSESDIKRISTTAYEDLNSKDQQLKYYYDDVNQFYINGAGLYDNGRLFIITSGFLLWLIIVVATFCIGNDYNYKTINVFASKTKWGKRMCIKTFSTLIFSEITILYSYLLSHVFSYFLQAQYATKVPKEFSIDFNNITHYEVGKLMGVLLLVSLFIICLLNIILIIFRNRAYIISFALVYILLPAISFFDIRGIIENILDPISNIDGAPSTYNCSLNESTCYMLIIGFIVVAIPLIYVIANKRDKYLD